MEIIQQSLMTRFFYILQIFFNHWLTVCTENASSNDGSSVLINIYLYKYVYSSSPAGVNKMVGHDFLKVMSECDETHVVAMVTSKFVGDNNCHKLSPHTLGSCTGK